MQRNLSIMNRTSRLATTALAALFATAPVAAFAQSSATGAPGVAGQSMSGANTANPGAASPGTATGTSAANSPASDTDQGQRLSQSTLENVQQQLQQQGYYKDASVDGKWGPRTRKALQSFQQAKGLQATGHLDQQTLGALGVNRQGG
jgi:peptidoglycan hydrolase-like protein with peptidoglycan-binding domain